MKGIVLAGGSGTRLYPVTRGVSKQLLPIYDKPMVYYPLSSLMLAGIRDILVISTPQDLGKLRAPARRRRPSSALALSYAAQPRPEGLAQAFLIGRDFVGTERVALALGDNVFYGHGFPELLARGGGSASAAPRSSRYRVRDPERYGVVELGGRRPRRSRIEEKPARPRVALRRHRALLLRQPGARHRRRAHALGRAASSRSPTSTAPTRPRASSRCAMLGRGIAWLDTGTHESLLQAAEFIAAVEQRQGLKVACLEEIAFRLGWLTGRARARRGRRLGRTEYADYLRRVVAEAEAMSAVADRVDAAARAC